LGCSWFISYTCKHKIPFEQSIRFNVEIEFFRDPASIFCYNTQPKSRCLAPWFVHSKLHVHFEVSEIPFKRLRLKFEALQLSAGKLDLKEESLFRAVQDQDLARDHLRMRAEERSWLSDFVRDRRLDDAQSDEGQLSHQVRQFECLHGQRH